MPLRCHEDNTFVIGDRMDATYPPEVWPEVAPHRHAVCAGSPQSGAAGLLMRVIGSDPEKRLINYQIVALVRMREVTRRQDGGYLALPESLSLQPRADLDGVVSRDDLRALLRRAAERDPEVLTGWRRPRMRHPEELAELGFDAVGEDLLRRLPMLQSQRIELITRSERERFRILVDQLREIADGAPPVAQRDQRLDRPLVDLPPYAIPVLPDNVYLSPGDVSTLGASAFISEKAFAAEWLAFTSTLVVGRAVMTTRPLRRADAPNADGFYDLTVDQIQPAIIRAVVPGEAGRSLVELRPAPSAAEAAGRGLSQPAEERALLAAHLGLLRRAYDKDPCCALGQASGSAYRRWQAGRFTSLRALLAWQIGQLGFDAQTVIDLQAIAWPDRLRAIAQALQALADGRDLRDARAAAVTVAAAALSRT